MDESGHDHKHLPYEARGGICLSDNRVWDFTCKMQGLEYFCFGDQLHRYKSELKATKLLNKKRFEWASYYASFPADERRELCRRFLAAGARREPQGRKEFAAFGQASLLFVRRLFGLLRTHDAHIFASLIPKGSHIRPDGFSNTHIRRDAVILFQRYFYFLEDRNQMGLIALDETDRTDDTRYLRKIEGYFRSHDKGRVHADYIVPTPFFVGSEMSYPIQAADIILYCLVQAHRQPKVGMNAPVREDVARLIGTSLNGLIYQSERIIDGAPYRPMSVFYVDHPWEIQKKKVSQTGVVFRAPQKTNLQ